MITFLTDHVVMSSKCHGKIPVGDNRRGTGVICKTCEEVNKTCEEVNIGTMNRYVQALYLSPGFSDFGDGHDAIVCAGVGCESGG